MWSRVREHFVLLYTSGDRQVLLGLFYEKSQRLSMRLPTLRQQGVETISPPRYYEPYGAIHPPETSLASENSGGFYRTKNLCDRQ